MTEEAERRGLTLGVELLFHGEPVVDPNTLFRGAAPESVIMLGVDQPVAVNAVTTLGCPAIIINGWTRTCGSTACLRTITSAAGRPLDTRSV